MASIQRKRNKFCVVYNYTDLEGKRKQKWETFDTKAEALNRKKEVEYRARNGNFVVPSCKTLKELMSEYVNLYGKDKWALSTYEANRSIINN